MEDARRMRRITFSEKELETLRNTLPDLVFHVSKDSPPTQPLLNRYLLDYGLEPLNTSYITYRVGAFDSKGHRICAHYWLPENPRGTTFIVHGYFDHTGLYGHLIAHLLSLGQAVVAFDLPGHGLSTGQRLAIDDFDIYQQVWCDVLNRCGHFPHPFNAVGQSTGAAIILRLLVTSVQRLAEIPFANIVLLAPLVRPWRWVYSKWLYCVLRPFVRSIPRRFRSNSHDREFVEFLAHGEPLQVRYIPMTWLGAMKQWIEDLAAAPVNDYPLRVIQGDGDTTVDSRYNLQQIRQKFPRAEVQMIPGAMHHLVNERADIRERVFEHIRFDGETG